MKYYRYRPDANAFNGVVLQQKDDAAVTRIYYGDDPILPKWVPITVEGLADNPGREGDFPTLYNFWRIPLMSLRALNSLLALIGDCCEALPIKYPSGEAFFIIHVMRTIDCLDFELSELTRNEVTGRVNRIYRYAFTPDMLQGKRIFKLPLESGGELLVDDEFRYQAERSGLKGLLLEELPTAS
jgi:hypothetical protein